MCELLTPDLIPEDDGVVVTLEKFAVMDVRVTLLLVPTPLEKCDEAVALGPPVVSSGATVKVAFTGVEL